MLTYIIRPAILHDILGITILMKQLGYSASLTEMKERFTKFIGNPGYDVAVACKDHEILGFIAWSKSMNFITPHTKFRIEGLVVDEQYRIHGIGRQLIEFLEEYAKPFSPTIIDLLSGNRRKKDGSHEFYKKLGFSNDGPYSKSYFRKEL